MPAHGVLDLDLLSFNLFLKLIVKIVPLKRSLFKDCLARKKGKICTSCNYFQCIFFSFCSNFG